MLQQHYISPVALSYAHVNGAGTTTIKSGGGLFQTLYVNSAAANSSIAIYDSKTGGGAAIANISFPAAVPAQPPVSYSLQFQNGLTFVTTGSLDLTISYR